MAQTIYHQYVFRSRQFFLHEEETIKIAILLSFLLYTNGIIYSKLIPQLFKRILGALSPSIVGDWLLQVYIAHKEDASFVISWRLREFYS